jgi:hypothetical protein
MPIGIAIAAARRNAAHTRMVEMAACHNSSSAVSILHSA